MIYCCASVKLEDLTEKLKKEMSNWKQLREKYEDFQHIWALKSPDFHNAIQCLVSEASSRIMYHIMQHSKYKGVSMPEVLVTWCPSPIHSDGRHWGNWIWCLFYHWQAFWGASEQIVSIGFHPHSSRCSFFVCLQLCLKMCTIISRHQFSATSWQFCMMSPFIYFKGDNW